MITTSSGLQYTDTTVGDGAEAQAGQKVTVHYTGWLYNDETQGAKFDSSKDRRDRSFFHSVPAWSFAAGTKAWPA